MIRDAFKYRTRQLDEHGISRDNEHGGGTVENAPGDNVEGGDDTLGGQGMMQPAGKGKDGTLGLMPAPSQGGRGQE